MGLEGVYTYPEHSIKFGGVMIMMMMLILRSVRITFMSSLVATSLVGEIQVRMTERERERGEEDKGRFL